MIAVITFHMVFSKAIGLKDFGVQYEDFPSLRRTTVVNSFHGLYMVPFSSIA